MQRRELLSVFAGGAALGTLETDRVEAESGGTGASPSDRDTGSDETVRLDIALLDG